MPISGQNLPFYWSVTGKSEGSGNNIVLKVESRTRTRSRTCTHSRTPIWRSVMSMRMLWEIQCWWFYSWHYFIVVSFVQVGFVNALAFSNDGNALIAGVGQEHKLGRWWRLNKAKNSVCVIPLQRTVENGNHDWNLQIYIHCPGWQWKRDIIYCRMTIFWWCNILAYNIKGLVSNKHFPLNVFFIIEIMK